MKIPDNFILMIVALVCIGIGYFIDTDSSASQMLNQFWAILLVLIRPHDEMLPSKQVQ